MQKVQDKQKKQADRRRREVDFDVEDMVWISMKNWKTDRSSRKLAHQMAGPYRILEKIGNLFKIDLLTSIKVYPVISPDRL